MDKKKTVVVGASPNPLRYSHRAVEALKASGHPVYAVGLREGEISGIPITTELKPISEVDTVTLYVGPRHQSYWKDFIHELNPKRVIFNPGTEEPGFESELRSKGIEVDRACTLVLLSMKSY
jgi:hypothetical protein